MKTPRGLVVLWLVAAALLATGVAARGLGVVPEGTRTAQEAAEPAAAEQGPGAPEAAFRRAAEQEPEGQEPEASGGVIQSADDSARASGVGGADPGQEIPTTTLGDTRQEVDVPLGQRLLSVLGLIAMLGIAWSLSVDRSRVPWRVVAWGMGLQLLFALFILKTPLGVAIFAGLNDVVLALLAFTNDGASFLFGNLVNRTVPVSGPEGGAAYVAETGANFAFSVLPTIIFFSSLMTVLYYIGIMQAAVRGMAWVMMRTMRTSGAETLSAAGNIFVGQTEAPLLVKPFIERMTTSELNTIMTCGFATVAGGVMAAYVAMLSDNFANIAGHLLAATIMSAPAAIVVIRSGCDLISGGPAT